MTDEQRTAEETRENLADVLQEKVQDHDSVSNATVTEVDIGADEQTTDFTVSVEREDEPDVTDESPGEVPDDDVVDEEFKEGRDLDIDHPDELEESDGFEEGERKLYKSYIRNFSEIGSESGEQGLQDSSPLDSNESDQAPSAMHPPKTNGGLQEETRQAVRQIAALTGGTLTFTLVALYAIWYGVTAGVAPVAAAGVLLIGVIFYHLRRLSS